ncbi:MAG: S8 family serine peptidase, partial [Alphaproteobacteria bacterium]|nr:S8 family serine peptidase [Alphaproteobacteria bacterium]
MAVCAAVLALSGCGGGGGSAPPTATSQTPIPPDTSTTVLVPLEPAPASFLRSLPRDDRQRLTDAQLRTDESNAKVFLESPEFKRSWHLEFINAHKAYARGATGEGEVVGVLDTTLHIENHEFAGDGKIVAARLVSFSGGQWFNDHGTAVASIAVGARGPSLPNGPVQGVAYDAKLAFANRGGGIHMSDKNFFSDHDAAIVNLSFGSVGNIQQHVE